MIGGIVLDPEYGTRIVGVSDVLEKPQVGGGIKHRVSPVEEARRVDLDAAEHLDTMSLSGDRHLGLAAASCPGLMQRGILSEARFIGMDQRRPSGFSVFFRLG